MINYILEAYFLFVIIAFVLGLILLNKRILSLSLGLGLFSGILYLGYRLELPVFIKIYGYFEKNLISILLVAVIISVPDIRVVLENYWKPSSKKEAVIMGSEQTKQSIVDAAMSLSQTKTGALITIEKHNTLDQFSERAIMMNCIVSKEVLMNIFTPNTPLHDGAVIIRGDSILCAAAYFILSDKENLGKTMGSRHRAGLGISEITDSLTIIVSEETGNVSIAVEGILLKINDREKLMEYVNMFMK